MKKEYVALIALLTVLAIISIWTSTQLSVHDVEQHITNSTVENSEHEEGIIEGGNITLYIAVAFISIVAAAVWYYVISNKVR